MEKYYREQIGEKYSTSKNSTSYSKCYANKESEKLVLPTWVKVIDFYLSQFDKKKYQEAAK